MRTREKACMAAHKLILMDKAVVSNPVPFKRFGVIL